MTSSSCRTVWLVFSNQAVPPWEVTTVPLFPTATNIPSLNAIRRSSLPSAGRRKAH